MKITKDTEEILEAVNSGMKVYFVDDPVLLTDEVHRYLTPKDISDILKAAGGEGRIVILDSGEVLEDTRVMVQGAPKDEPNGWEEEDEALHNA